MSLKVRDGIFDAIVFPGARVQVWPSVGAKVLTKLCGEYGLSVGMVGVEGLNAVGVVPESASGGIVYCEDIQKRIHRLRARAIIKFSVPPDFCEPFQGWVSEGLFPYSTIYRLKKSNSLKWSTGVAILGSSNRAFRLGSELLEENNYFEVTIVESGQFESDKKLNVWEVEKRRFESLGGKIVYGKCKSLIQKGPVLWELRVQDLQGIRILEVCRVVSTGPFGNHPDYREYPLGSNLFEIFQTALDKIDEDIENWIREEEVSRLIAGKLIKRISLDPTFDRLVIEGISKKSKRRLKKLKLHYEKPWIPSYDGKLLSKASRSELLSESGVPKEILTSKPVATIECHEDIECQICQKHCPELAIDFLSLKLKPVQILDASKCTGCGICVQVCPSNAISMLQEDTTRQKAFIYRAAKNLKNAKNSEFVDLLNRRGESLGAGRVTKDPIVNLNGIVKVEVPPYLIWDVREFRRSKVKLIEEDAQFLHANQFESQSHKHVEVIVKGNKRLIRDNISLAQAFFEIGQIHKEEMLFCKDGSCGLCSSEVDGIHKKTCQTSARQGMVVKSHRNFELKSASSLCPCLDIEVENFKKIFGQLQGSKVESVFEISGVTGGRCHGMRCQESARQIMIQMRDELAKVTKENWPIEFWIDWKFPMFDWTLYSKSKIDL